MPADQPLAGRRIGLLTASASRAGGGVFEAVVRQAVLIEALGGEPVVVALADEHSAADRRRFGNTEVWHAPIIGPRQIGLAPSIGRTLAQAKLDLLHLHGIWMYPSHAGAHWAATTKRPYIVSPHGMLDPWITARGKRKKALARWGYERRNWAAATMLHALTDDEAADIATEAGRTGSLVIPNAAPAITDGQINRNGVLYLGRIHPKKNLLPLIEAWRQSAVSEARLTIAGWGDPADVSALEAAVARAGASVRFVGAVQGDAKQALLQSARWLILPSLSEGLPMVVLEAWAAGTPTLMTPACHLPEGFASGAAVPCGDTANTIASTLVQALAMTDAQWQRHAIAAAALAAGPFSEAAVAARWAKAYGALLS